MTKRALKFALLLTVVGLYLLPGTASASVSGRFTITIPAPDGVPAAAYRARTKAPTIATGRIANVFTLPRALDL